VALAQIYGLQIPVGELDDGALQRLDTALRLAKGGFNPEQPRVPAGQPHGEWTYVPGYAKPRQHGGGPDGEATDGGAPPEPPPGAGGDEPPRIPTQPPETPQERNRTARRAAEWLKRALTAGARSAPHPGVRAFLAILRGAWWLADNLPRIRSYLDDPKTLQELQDAVAHPAAGYERHHIVEGQHRSVDELANWKRFPGRLESRDNLVLIPYYKHVEVSSWYSTSNRQEFGGKTPREFLRGKGWDEQYELV